MKNLLLVALVLSAGYLFFHDGAKLETQNGKLLSIYAQFVAKYGKNYNKSEYQLRFQIFKQRVAEMNQHNTRYNEGKETYYMGINIFSDKTDAELQAMLMTGVPSLPENVNEVIYPEDDINETVDWRTKGVVQKVKNQGSCGSCWAFSVVGQLESTFAIAGRGLQDMAEQQLVDCSSVSPYKCYGCSGCWPKDAYDYVKDKGVTLTSKYPYTARQGTCKVTSGEYTIKSYDMVQAGNVDQLAAYTKVSPVSVCVDASNWFSYSGGIFKNCGTQLNHAVLLVGYSDECWFIKNSWGNWGEQGYIRLARGNTCGIANHSLRASV